MGRIKTAIIGGGNVGIDLTNVYALADAAKRYGLRTADILVERGRRRMVGGQEGSIVAVAPDLLQAREGHHSELVPVSSRAA